MSLNRLYCYQKLFLTIIWSHYPSPYLQFKQNVLLNDRSLGTFPILTPKYGGSFMRVFTVFFTSHVKEIEDIHKNPVFWTQSTNGTVQKWSNVWPTHCLDSYSCNFQSFKTLPDLSYLLSTTLSNGGSVDPLLTHEPFALTTSNLVGCQVYLSRFPEWQN